MKTTIEKHKDGTIELIATIAWKDVSKTYDQVLEKEAKSAELPGFRKGKAPKKLVEEKLDKTKVYETVLRQLIPSVYNDAVTQHELKPIVTPKVELTKAKEGEDWIVSMFTCQKPDVTLGNYKKAIKDLKAAKGKKIWVPGEKKTKKEEEENKKPTVAEILDAVFGEVKTTIPKLLIDQHVNKMLSDLIEQTRKLGLTVEQYLESTGKTSESIRSQYQEEAVKTLTLEFALEEIADKDAVLVSDDDIEKVIKSGKTKDEQDRLSKDRYYIASVLRRQKTIDHLSNL